jgi:hypothetical protein
MSRAIALNASPQRPAAVDPLSVNAPLFRRLVEGLSPDRRAVVLDLGLARAETVALFSPFRCRLDVADLADGLDELIAEPDPALLPERVEALLPPRRSEPTDIVLCWDLLNYLPRPALTALMDNLASRSRPGTWVHFMVVYSGTRMAARPNHYAPRSDGTLLTIPVTRTEREAPRYSSEDLSRCLRGYTAESSVLLRNGMQECLYRL